MKKIILSMLIIFSFAQSMFAMDFIVGAKGGYFAWDPFIKEIGGTGFASMKTGRGALYGPVLSILISDDLSFSIAALTGTQSAYWYSANKEYQTDDGDTFTSSGTYYFETKRTDLDSAISYRLFDSLKIFGGYKFQWMTNTMKYTERRGTPGGTGEHVVSEQNMQMKIPASGPAAGLGYSLNLGSKGFFAAVNLSGVYMTGTFKFTKAESISYSSSDLYTYTVEDSSDKTKPIDVTQMGLNFEPSVGLSVPDTGIIFTVGLRYQYMETNMESDDSEMTKDGLKDKLYGVFISVLYAI